MNDEQRENIRKANRSRAAHVCQKCGQMPVQVRDGPEIGGLPGIKYRCCGSCGWTQAITRRQPREKL